LTFKAGKPSNSQTMGGEKKIVIVRMQAGIGSEDPRVIEVVDTARKYKLNPDIKTEEGKAFRVVEIYLLDGERKACELSEHIFKLPGVESVERVTPARVTLAYEGGIGAHHIKLSPSITVGEGLPCQLVFGPCTVDRYVGDIVESLAEAGVKMVRGGIWKPRSRPGSHRGYGRKGAQWLFEAASRCNIEVVFTEVIEAHHIDVVREEKVKAGYKGTIVLWVGARTSNSILLSALGEQTEFPVMIKNTIAAHSVQDLFERAEWVLTGKMHWSENGELDRELSMDQGNDQLILCLRGIEKSDATSVYRFDPNHHWARTLRDRSWAPICIDPSHSAGTMQDDLVLKNLEAALVHDPDLVMVEGGYPGKGYDKGFRGVCDDKQSIPRERIREVINMVKSHNVARFGKEF